MAWNWGGSGKGALGGASSGATIGSVVPGIGTAIGAGVGGLLGLLGGGFGGGKKSGFKNSPNKFTPEQQNALNMLLQKSQSTLQNPTAGFEPIEQQARNKFQSESIPSLAERFTSMGGSGTRGSSDLLGSLGGAQSDFDQGIAAQKAWYGQQNEQNALQQLLAGLTPQTEQYYQKSEPGFGSQLLETGGNALGSYIGGGGTFGNGGSISSSNENIIDLLKKILANRQAGA